MGSGSVTDADFDIRMLLLEQRQPIQQQTVESGFGCSDADCSTVQTEGKPEFLFASQDAFTGGSNISVKHLALRSQGDAVTGTDKKAAAQLAF